jgi:DTW domain-containing protein YfiP
MTQTRLRCARCQRPPKTCLCPFITPTANRTELVILQHPLEVNNAKNTAGLLQLSLSLCQRHEGETFSEAFLHELLTRGGKINLLLYPPTADAGVLSTPPPHLPNLTGVKPEQLRLILLDGTWRKSRKMLYLNPLLQQLPRLALTDCGPSRYHIRKAQGQDQLSSLEASCYALRHLENEQVDYQPLLNAFDQFIARQLAFIPARLPSS